MSAKRQAVAISVEGLAKTFRLPHEKTSSIKSALINFRKRRTYEKQEVLRDITFDVKKGEFFGIVGRNGSGKSTLLKLLAGIYTPTKGEVHINGRLTPFIELGVGFNMELTGRENVFLNGALLGFNRSQMSAMYDDIVKFAEIENFMDQKLKNYSSGMQVRLAFSIAIRAKADILLIDEVLAVGDASFQQKCFEVFAQLKKKGTTIILVTHDMSSVLRFCDRAMLIHDGDIVTQGKPALVADTYLELNYENTEKAREATQAAGTSKEAKIDQTVPQIESVVIQSASGQVTHRFTNTDKVKVVVHYQNKNGVGTHFGLQIFNDAGVYCFGSNTKISGLPPQKKKTGNITIDLEPKLAPGNYYINVASMNDNGTTVYNYKTRAVSFRIVKDTQIEGIATLEHAWRYDNV